MNWAIIIILVVVLFLLYVVSTQPGTLKGFEAFLASFLTYRTVIAFLLGLIVGMLVSSGGKK